MWRPSSKSAGTTSRSSWRPAGDSSKRAANVALAVRCLVARTHELGILYASEDWSPISDITFALLLERAGVRWRYTELHGLAEIVWPPVCGIHVMHVNRAQQPGEKRLAIRHGLGHILAGDVTERAFRHEDREWFSHEETVADLFALVDLIADRMLDELWQAGYSRDEVRHWVWCEIKRYAPSWPPERLHDRVRLRLVL